ELLDATQDREIVVAVPAAAAGRAVGLDQALAVIDSERLWMHTRELGGHRDPIHGLGSSNSHGSTHPPTPRRSRGGAFVRAARASTASFCSFDNLAGTATSTRTMRSPVPFLDSTPRPFTRNTLPELVPAGIFNVTGSPSSVGTRSLVPSAASGKVIGTVSVR